MMNTETIKSFKWLTYPAVVAAGAVALGVQIVSPVGIVSGLRKGWEEVKNERLNVGRLEMRVATLEKVSEGEADDDLRNLFSILPVKKELLPLISGLRIAADRSGVKLEGYSAAGGGIKGSGSGDEKNLKVDASLVGDWPAITLFVAETEKQLPLRRVNEVNFAFGKTRVVVEGRWAPLANVVDLAGRDIPDYRASLSEAVLAVAGYDKALEASGSGEPIGEANPNLF